MSGAGATVTLRRTAQVFAERAAAQRRPLRPQRRVLLAPDQIFHAEVPADVLVRLGKLRVSQMFADGREVTRAVLQAGAAFLTRRDPQRAPDAAADVYCLPDLILMALGEAELWILPAGSLELDP